MINSFTGVYAFLSNFYPCEIEKDGIKFPTVEHYFQACKTLDLNKCAEIAAAATPGEAKRLGRRVKLREDWEEVKDAVMEEGLRKKFKNPRLKAALLSTGDAYLIEGNTWHDNYWGACRCARCRNRQGQNHLGELLMKIRDEDKGR